MWQSKACAPAYTSPPQYPLAADHTVCYSPVKRTSTAEEHLDRAAERIQSMFTRCPESYKLDSELPKDAVQGKNVYTAGSPLLPDPSLKHWQISSIADRPANTTSALPVYSAQLGSSAGYGSPAALSSASPGTHVYSPPAYFSPSPSSGTRAFSPESALTAASDCRCINGNPYSVVT